MKNDTKRQRKTGDQTRKAILKAARRLFVKKGFGATSLFEIAKTAKINHSLIFHHFNNKKNLWKAVKQAFVDQEPEDLRIDIQHGLHAFLTQIITERFDFFSKHPDMLRMINWQHLENESEELVGTTSASPDRWREEVILLQKNHEIKSDLDPDSVCLLIMSSLSGVFSNYRSFARNPIKRESYVKMIIDLLSFSLAPD